jgi:exodeoxyribonuclease VII large subunit
MAMKPIGVSQLNAYIKRVLQTDPILSQVSVLGEISNLKYHDSGHVYFSLKDQGGKINCFLPAGVAAGMSSELEDGMQIVAIGNVSVFERGGYYSLQIKAVELTGIGDLGAAFEALKKKLLGEGLFDASHKKTLPAFPSKVAIITAQTGAAIQDMIKIISGRNHVVDIVIIPVLVQGPGASASICQGIRTVNDLYPEVDVMIVGRGGGSLEELWAFNEENVARSIFESKIPVISAVGHETDVTIADFVADVRAETPSAAAVLAVPDTKELRIYLDFLQDKIQESVIYWMERKSEHLSRLDLDVFRQGILSKIQLLALRKDTQKEQMQKQLETLLNRHAALMDQYRLVLEHLNPKSIMRRGYAAVTNIKGELITSTATIKANDPLTLVMQDGTANATVTKVEREKNG